MVKHLKCVAFSMIFGLFVIKCYIDCTVCEVLLHWLQCLWSTVTLIALFVRYCYTDYFVCKVLLHWLHCLWGTVIFALFVRYCYINWTVCDLLQHWLCCLWLHSYIDLTVFEVYVSDLWVVLEWHCSYIQITGSTNLCAPDIQSWPFTMRLTSCFGFHFKQNYKLSMVWWITTYMGQLIAAGFIVVNCFSHCCYLNFF